MARPTAPAHGNPALERPLGTSRRPGPWKRGDRGLTLIELLVVIVIIGILASVGITVATKVSQGGKVTATQEALKIGDQALNSYVQEKGAIPPPIFEDPRDPARQRLIAVADARNMSTNRVAKDRTIINSCGLFIYQAEKDAGMTGLFAGIDEKILRKHDADSADGQYLNGTQLNTKIDQMAPPSAPNGPAGAPAFDDQPWLPTLMDGFGRPIRYVHPAFGGIIAGPNRAAPNYTAPWTALNMTAPGMFGDWATGGRLFSYNQIRRNSKAQATAMGNPNPEFLADSDGGRPVGNRPYFYSAGADGNPSTIDDNVYTGGSKPEFDAPN